YFDRWSKKAILTSKVRTQWGTQEFLLQKNGFVTFTTAFQSQDIQELNLLASITTETPGFAKNNSTPGRYLPIQISNLDDLYDYCDNNDLYRWICCLAIYPVIDWNLAIAIGNALQEKIADNKNKPLVSYDHLSQIARINWVIEGRIPDALKLAMLDELSDDLTIIARKCLSNLFNQFRNSITPKSYIKDEFEYLDQVNSFIIHTLTNDEVDPQLKSVINLYRKRRYLDSVSEQYLNGKFGLIKRDGIAISSKQYFENYQPNAKIAFHILGAPIRDWQLISYTAIVIFLFSVFNPNLFKNNDSHTYQFVLDSLLMENIKPDDIKLHINNTDQALVQYLNGIYHYEDFSPDITKVPVKIYIYYASGILRSKAFFLRSPDYKVSFSKPTTLNNLRPRKNDPSFSPQQQQQQQQEQPADTIKK
ncbi:MAG: hypothetical protein JWQ57_5104, partial [Mucilaginibacter sp.]|nr:hypothetical protein [Mucilaginibacter sp.]